LPLSTWHLHQQGVNCPSRFGPCTFVLALDESARRLSRVIDTDDVGAHVAEHHATQ
jgi:hypothetical protein